MLFNSFSFATFLPLVFGIYWLMTYTPQGYRGGSFGWFLARESR